MTQSGSDRLPRDVPRRVLITGIAGSGGSYLAEYIVAAHPEVEVHGLARWHSATRDNLHAIREQLTVHEADLMDIPSVLEVLRAVRPEAIFHLAAHANVRASFITPISVLANNVMGTANLLEAVRATGDEPVIQVCSTSEVYGQVDPTQVPITEDTPFRPASPYAVSKAAQDLLGWTYFVSYAMPIIRTRMFSYVNPRRADLFATSFARQIAWIERGWLNELVHGNLESVRTMIDVRDAMRAYWEAIRFCRAGEAYNIGGTTTVTVGEVLERLVAMSRVPVRTRTDPALLRPADVTLQIPSVEKFRRETGWTAHYSFEESLAYLLDHWRQEAERAAQRREAAVRAGRATKGAQDAG